MFQAKHITNRPGYKDNLSPALLFDEPLKLTEGRTLTLKYRIFIHEGTLSASKLQMHWKKFAMVEHMK